MPHGNETATSPHAYRGAVESIVAAQSLIGVALHIHSWADVASILDPANPVVSYGTGHLIWSVVSGLGLCIYKLKSWVGTPVAADSAQAVTP